MLRPRGRDRIYTDIGRYWRLLAKHSEPELVHEVDDVFNIAYIVVPVSLFGQRNAA